MHLQGNNQLDIDLYLEYTPSTRVYLLVAVLAKTNNGIECPPKL
jgi:hypothetical protein